MKLFKISIIIVGILFGALLVTTAILPSEIIIKRHIIIHSPSNIPYELVNDLKFWKEWFSIFDMDDNIKYNYYNKGKVLNEMRWISANPNVGEGKLKIKSRKANKQIMVLVTLQNEKEGTFIFLIQEKKQSSRLVLEFRTKTAFFEKWMGFILETVIGPTLEKSLDNLKIVSENINSGNNFHPVLQ